MTLGHSAARHYVQGLVVALGQGRQYVLLAQTISFYSINNCLSSLVSLEVSAVVARGMWVLRSASRLWTRDGSHSGQSGAQLQAPGAFPCILAGAHYTHTYSVWGKCQQQGSISTVGALAATGAMALGMYTCCFRVFPR